MGWATLVTGVVGVVAILVALGALSISRRSLRLDWTTYQAQRLVTLVVALQQAEPALRDVLKAQEEVNPNLTPAARQVSEQARRMEIRRARERLRIGPVREALIALEMVVRSQKQRTPGQIDPYQDLEAQLQHAAHQPLTRAEVEGILDYLHQFREELAALNRDGARLAEVSSVRDWVRQVLR